MSYDAWGWVAGTAFFGALAVLVYLAVLYSMPQCRQCQRRGTIRWHRERVNGGPDHRFRDNFQYCQACGFGRREES